jgi:hypothetical protein
MKDEAKAVCSSELQGVTNQTTVLFVKYGFLLFTSLHVLYNRRAIKIFLAKTFHETKTDIHFRIISHPQAQGRIHDYLPGEGETENLLTYLRFKITEVKLSLRKVVLGSGGIAPPFLTSALNGGG